jgi:hypothetical protein
MPHLPLSKALAAAALALVTATAGATVATSSAVSDSVEVSSRAITHSLKRSSDSSSGRPLAQGDYRVTQVAQVAPEVQEVTLQAVPGTGARGEIVLHMPDRAVQQGGVAVGLVVAARERPYGYELARADTRAAFFLLLDDPWYRELQSVPVRL